MIKEIERKFLVRSEDFKLAAVSCTHIIQGYICRESGRTVRVRLEGEAGRLTIKGRSSEDGTLRSEWEYEIPAADARSMFSICTGKLIEKDRYSVPVGELKWEIDVFHGVHEGLIIAEVELPSENEKFELPSWVGNEVTGERRYYNSVLSAE